MRFTLKVAFTRSLLIAATVILPGCIRPQAPEPVVYSQTPGGKVQSTVELSIPRKKLQKALTRGSEANEIRLVQVFRREDQPLPQYRLFSVQHGSIYDLLGLQETDILLAADDHVVFEPAAFRTFVVQYLPTQNDASITLMRDGVAMLYRYHITD